jgi:hypothetical protein
MRPNIATSLPTFLLLLLGQLATAEHVLEQQQEPLHPHGLAALPPIYIPDEQDVLDGSPARGREHVLVRENMTPYRLFNR